ncbi:hypothetical protein Cabys_2218 [Caldithrix abyssi DSM 13497]|uniref:Uncharacterized protein n=1 Tax=Caldithrix abyssi DSM 13497 TaxID=880073 RepID=A0A1J1C8J5_CALAY|nr:hypothetical protein Cabys_2218 [Caldithrix abyssi DSM 13497]
METNSSRSPILQIGPVPDAARHQYKNDERRLLQLFNF